MLVQFSLTRDSGQAFTVRQYTLRTESSAVDVDRVWMPWNMNTWVEAVGLLRTTRYSSAVAWRDRRHGYRTMADRGIPIVFALDRTAAPDLAVGFLDQRLETEITHTVVTHQASGLQDCGTVRFNLQRPFNGYTLANIREHHDGFFVASGSSWFDATVSSRLRCHSWAPDSPQSRRRLGTSSRTMGCHEGKLNSKSEEILGPNELWETAKSAVELGIKGFINWGTGVGITTRITTSRLHLGLPRLHRRLRPQSEVRRLQRIRPETQDHRIHEYLLDLPLVARESNSDLLRLEGSNGSTRPGSEDTKLQRLHVVPVSAQPHYSKVRGRCGVSDHARLPD